MDSPLIITQKDRKTIEKQYNKEKNLMKILRDTNVVQKIKKELGTINNNKLSHKFLEWISDDNKVKKFLSKHKEYKKINVLQDFRDILMDVFQKREEASIFNKHINQTYSEYLNYFQDEPFKEIKSKLFAGVVLAEKINQQWLLDQFQQNYKEFKYLFKKQSYDQQIKVFEINFNKKLRLYGPQNGKTLKLASYKILNNDFNFTQFLSMKNNTNNINIEKFKELRLTFFELLIYRRYLFKEVLDIPELYIGASIGEDNEKYINLRPKEKLFKLFVVMTNRKFSSINLYK